MTNKYLVVLFSFYTSLFCAQNTIDKVLKTYNNNSVPYISSNDLNKLNENVVLLDARELKEYNVSHLKNAINVGYKKFNIQETIAKVNDKNTKIVVYCSIGVRSERIAEKLSKSGYLNVYNLYGGIFDWKNNDFEVVDSNNKVTENVHAYSKGWSKYLIKGNKIY